jgi:2'-5' RNA ligase
LRLFLAIELAKEIKEALSAAREGLRHFYGPDLRLSPIEGLHLTVRFIGECNDALQEQLVENLPSIIREQSSFEITVGGYGLFPPAGPPRVVWCGVHEAADELTRMWASCERLCRELGVGEDRHGMTPHVTLGRIKARIDRQEFERRLLRLPPLALRQPVTHLSIFQSETGSEGPRYTPIRSLPLSGG